MNNHRLLTGLLAATLLSGGVCASGQSSQVMTIEDLFEIAETNSVASPILYCRGRSPAGNHRCPKRTTSGYQCLTLI